MRKLMKTTLIITIILTLFVSHVEARGLNKDKAVKVLVNAGWTLEDINDLLNEDALLEYADAILVGTSDKYIKVTGDKAVEVSKKEAEGKVQEFKRKELINSIIDYSLRSPGDIHQNPVTTTDRYMHYYVQSYDLGGGEFMLSARCEWLINPKNRREDVFGLGHDDQLTQISSNTPYYVYKVDIVEHDKTGTTSEYTYTNNTPDGISKDPGGTVVKQKLLKDISIPELLYSKKTKNHRQYLQYKVRVNNTGATDVSVYAEYLHQQYSYNVSPSISYPAGGSIGISYVSHFKRMSPNPYLSFNVK